MMIFCRHKKQRRQRTCGKLNHEFLKMTCFCFLFHPDVIIGQRLYIIVLQFCKTRKKVKFEEVALITTSNERACRVNFFYIKGVFTWSANAM